MSHRTSYRWAAGAAVVVVVAGVAVITAWAAPMSSPDPATARPAGAAAATSRPSRAAEPPVMVSTTPAPMPAAFLAVRTRSIFLKGNQQLVIDRGSNPAPRDPTPNRPQASLVFNGVTVVGDRADAMIEDTNAHKVFTVRVGELLAGGRVLGITFDDLEYQNAGKVTRVALGQTLEGSSPALLPDVAPVPGGGPPPADSAGTLGNTVGMSPEDILARMKKRRQQEMGGGK